MRRICKENRREGLITWLQQSRFYFNQEVHCIFRPTKSIIFAKGGRRQKCFKQR